MAMLHFLHCCLNGNTSQKKMFFKIHVLYIDEARSVYGVTQEEADARIALVTEACQQYGFNYTILPIERVFELSRDALNEAPEDMDHAKYKVLSETLSVNQTVHLAQPEKFEEYSNNMQ